MSRYTWKEMRPYFISLIKKGKTDKEITPLMKKRFGGKWTVHMVRSERGRLERARLVKRGLSGSSTKKKVEKKMTRKKKRKHESWSAAAISRAVELAKAGLKPQQISRQLKKEKLRTRDNPRAVSDTLRRVRLQTTTSGKPKVDTRSVASTNGKNSVILRSEVGQLQFDDLPPHVFADVQRLCVEAHFGLAQ